MARYGPSSVIGWEPPVVRPFWQTSIATNPASPQEGNGATDTSWPVAMRLVKARILRGVWCRSVNPRIHHGSGLGTICGVLGGKRKFAVAIANSGNAQKLGLSQAYTSLVPTQTLKNNLAPSVKGWHIVR